MKKHFIHTIISVMVFWGVYSPAVALSAEDNQSFLDMINKIREAPYKYAIDLGYLPESLVEKEDELREDFEPYTLDEDLTAMAENESQIMAGEEISESEGTEPPVYRLTASTGGVVSFFNFMPRNTAFKIVIDYLFKKELDPANESPRYILSKEYSSAGIAISAGKVGSGNAWFVAICLRSSELVSEIQMLNLINQVRANPENLWKYTQLNEEYASTLNPNISDSLVAEYKPLFFNASLSEFAQDYSDYVFTKKYPEYLSEKNTPLERAGYYGYEGEAVQEKIGPPVPVLSSPEEKALPVDSLFKYVINEELRAEDPLGFVVFLKDFQDVGYSVAFQRGDRFDISVPSFIVGRNNPNASSDENSSSNNEQTSRIYGVLFSDDGDELYAPGEEIIQQTVTAYDDEMKAIEAVTDNAGHFSMTLHANRQYFFTATIQGVPFSWGDIPITSDDQFVKLAYYPPVTLAP